MSYKIPLFTDWHGFLVSALPQPPPTPINPILTESLAALLPAELSLETFNSQYLQRHSGSAKAILAAAKVSRKLDAPRNEIEDIAFTALEVETQPDIKVTCIAAISVTFTNVHSNP